MTKELKKIFPGVKYTLSPYADGTTEEVIVSPVPFGRIGEFGDAVTALFARVAGDSAEALKAEDLMDLGRVFTVAADETVMIMCMVLGKERDWFDNVTTADGFGLLDIIVEQNLNEQVKKNILRIVETIKKQFVLTS